MKSGKIFAVVLMVIVFLLGLATFLYPHIRKAVVDTTLRNDAQEFIDRCEANSWLDGKGRPVINWRTWLTGYALKAIRPEEGGAARQETFISYCFSYI